MTLLGSWNTPASRLAWIASKIHQLQTLTYYGLDQSRYHGRATAVKNQMTVHKNQGQQLHVEVRLTKRLFFLDLGRQVGVDRLWRR